jgi:hypothetical protein
VRGHDLTKDQSKKAMEKQKEISDRLLEERDHCKEISDRLLEERDHCKEAFEQAQQAQQQAEQQRQELWQQLQEAGQQLQTLQTLQTALEASRAQVQEMATHTKTLEDQVIYDAIYFALLAQKYYAMYLLF